LALIGYGQNGAFEQALWPCLPLSQARSGQRRRADPQQGQVVITLVQAFLSGLLLQVCNNPHVQQPVFTLACCRVARDLLFCWGSPPGTGTGLAGLPSLWRCACPAGSREPQRCQPAPIGIAVIQQQQLHLPGARRPAAQATRPFHRQQGSACLRLFLLLGEQFIGGGGLLEAVQVEMDQGRGSAARAAAVVLGQGEGGAGDRLSDAQLLSQALHQAGLAGPEISG